jgi:iron complex outermembrane receptor protein
MSLRLCAAPFLVAVLFAVSLPAQEERLDDLLALDLDELASLEVVSALKGPGTINRVPATVRVVSAEEIARNGYLTIEDALADLPGFQFRDILGFNSYVFLRGVPSQNNKILLLVDGIEINELNSGGFYGGGQFDLANVERIEVVYGPGSVLYGTNAVSGIVNVITRDPRTSSGGSVGVAAGNLDTRAFDARWSGGDEARELSFSLSGMWKESGKADLRGGSGDHNWTDSIDNFEDDSSVAASIRWKDLSAGLLVQDKNASRASVERSAGTLFSDEGVNWHIRFLNAHATWAPSLPPGWAFRSTAYYRDSTVLDDTVPVIERATADSDGRQYRWYRPSHLIGGEGQLTFAPSSRFETSFGIVLERERLAERFSITESDSEDAKPPQPAAPPMVSNGLVSLYAQTRVQLAEGADLFVGLRHDDSSCYDEVDTPRAGLVVNRGRLTAKALWGEAFRAPKPWDFTSGEGNPSLRPEKMRSFELAAAWSFSPHLRGELSLYRNRLDDLLTREVAGNGGWRWGNAGRLDTDGLEAELEYRKRDLRAFVAYTLTDSTFEDGSQVPEISRHGANAGFSLAMPHGASLSLRGRYLGARTNPKTIPSTGDDRIDRAFVFDGSLSARMAAGVEIRLVVENLLNSVYYHPSDLSPSRYRQPERTLRLQIRHDF